MPISLTAIAAIALAAIASRMIKKRAGAHLEQAGSGDAPGAADRGPDGQRM